MALPAAGSVPVTMLGLPVVVVLGTPTGLKPAFDSCVQHDANCSGVAEKMQGMPASNTIVQASSINGTASKPANNLIIANGGTTIPVSLYGTVASTVTLAPASIGAVGGNQPHENQQPYNTVNYIIATVGVFPSQS